MSLTNCANKNNPVVMKSCSDGELLSSSRSNPSVGDNKKLNKSTFYVDQPLNNLPTSQTRFKRTFTLPRNPLRISKRKPKHTDNLIMHSHENVNNVADQKGILIYLIFN